MAKAFAFDTFDQGKIDALREARKPAAKAVQKHQSRVYECAECGDTRGPHWGEFGEFFCRRHAPDHLKHPGAV